MILGIQLSAKQTAYSLAAFISATNAMLADQIQ